MQLFYTQQITNDSALFDEAESAHALQVLRLKSGDEIHFTNGQGLLYKGIIALESKKIICAQNIELIKQIAAPQVKINLWVAPTKNADRYEWLVEKAVELGVWSITPIITNRTVKKTFTTRRIKTIALSGMKQSLQLHLAEVHEPLELKKAIIDSSKGAYYLAHCLPDAKKELRDYSFTEGEITLLIGPEGDFTDEEIKFLLDKGCIPVGLGETRLRTETAGLYAVMAVILDTGHKT